MLRKGDEIFLHVESISNKQFPILLVDIPSWGFNKRREVRMSNIPLHMIDMTCIENDGDFYSLMEDGVHSGGIFLKSFPRNSNLTGDVSQSLGPLTPFLMLFSFPNYSWFHLRLFSIILLGFCF